MSSESKPGIPIGDFVHALAPCPLCDGLMLPDERDADDICRTCTAETWFAAIIDDGMRSVVWGLGSTESEAFYDAAQWISEHHETIEAMKAEVATMTARAITARQASIIRAGAVSWPVGE